MLPPLLHRLRRLILLPPLLKTKIIDEAAQGARNGPIMGGMLIGLYATPLPRHKLSTQELSRNLQAE